MHTINENGISYTKAAVLAKKYKYTTDYIGQLCRGKKVLGKLVGRSWFVNEASLAEHMQGRYSTTRDDEIVIKKSLVSHREASANGYRIAVRPVLAKATHKSIVSYSATNLRSAPIDIAVVNPRYVSDKFDLAPVIKSRYLQPEQDFGGKKLEVNLQDRATQSLEFEELPEVSLNGELVISSLDDTVSEINPEIVSPEVLGNVHKVESEKPAGKAVVIKRYSSLAHRGVPSSHAQQSMPFKTANVDYLSTDEQKNSKPRLKADFHPTSVLRYSPKESNYVPALIFFMISVLASTFLLGFTSVSQYDEFGHSDSQSFSASAVVESFKNLQ